MANAQNIDDSGDSDDLQTLFDTIAATSPPDPQPSVAPPASKGGDAAGDSDELQDLFDSVAGSKAAEPPRASPPPPKDAGGAGDSDELQDLFDSVAGQQAVSQASTQGPDGEPTEAVFNRLGHLARQLHDSMHELGVDKAVEEGARQMPDVMQRLHYIATMTEQAASKVLNAADIAVPIQESMAKRSEQLASRWDQMFANKLSVDEFKALAAETRDYLKGAPEQHKATHAQLMEITMAQDFQDLTGQVVKKVVDIIQNLETQLIAVLIEAMPPELKAEAPEVVVNSGLMNGPVVVVDGRNDVVTTQAQVDDLLESLGF